MPAALAQKLWNCYNVVWDDLSNTGVRVQFSSVIVQKLWNYCNVLRDDELSYLLARGAQASGDYPSAESILNAAEGLRTGSEQLTFLLLLKTADKQP